MVKYTALSLLREKIEELQHALFFNSGNAVLKISNQVTDAICVDECGQIWFVVPKPGQLLSEFDREFPARLNFFKKGKQFYVNVSGKAFITSDPEELNGLYFLSAQIRQKVRNGEVVLMKMKIQQAEYFETADAESRNWLVKMKSQLSNWVYIQRHGQSTEEKKTAFHELYHLPGMFSN